MNNLQILIDKFGNSPTLDTTQIAEVMKVRPQTVRNQFAENKLPFIAMKSGVGKRCPIVAPILNVARWMDGVTKNST